MKISKRTIKYILPLFILLSVFILRKYEFIEFSAATFHLKFQKTNFWSDFGYGEGIYKFPSTEYSSHEWFEAGEISFKPNLIQSNQEFLDGLSSHEIYHYYNNETYFSSSQDSSYCIELHIDKIEFVGNITRPFSKNGEVHTEGFLYIYKQNEGFEQSQRVMVRKFTHLSEFTVTGVCSDAFLKKVLNQSWEKHVFQNIDDNIRSFDPNYWKTFN